MKSRIALAMVLAAGCGTALGAAKVASVKAVQSAPLEAQVTVTIERPTPIDMMCDTAVDLGDGSSQSLNFGVGDKRTKTLQHKYAKPGTYKVVVKATGKCEGMREASVTIQGAGAPAKAADAAASKASIKSTRCPKGWSVVPSSFQGNRYTCQANPPSKPIKCEGDTKYFSENGVIGCR